MLLVLMVLFIVLPSIEIALFIQVGHLLGVWLTVGLVLLSALVGASLVRSQGLQTLTSMRAKLQQGELPTEEIGQGVLLVIAGVLLITPGFFTDFVGAILLLPMFRPKIAHYMMQRISTQQGGFAGRPFGHQGPSQSDRSGNTFEGEYEQKDDQDRDKLN